MEILVLDGRSTDNTREIVQQMVERDPRIRLLDNPRLIQSTAMNIGIEQARGEFIMRLDAHSLYPLDYLRQCYATARRSNADNVGGLVITEPGGHSYSAALVQALTTHRFGVGDSGFRTGASEGQADTVPFGFFRRDIFQRVGGFDERLVRSQDYEFNRRIIRHNGVVWLNPAIQVRYYNQPSLIAFYRKQMFREGPYNAYLWYVAPYAFAPRHSVTAVFAAGVIVGAGLAPVSRWLTAVYFGTLALYVLLAVASAVQQARRYRQLWHVFALPCCFFAFHFLHGLGVLSGLIRLATGTAPVQKSLGRR